jgi:tetratricopeptide (TPR) repeat protein
VSKRSSRRKRKARARKKSARLTGPVLTQQGKTAFDQSDYNAAIDAWEKARYKPNAPANLSTALAEAYFRRAFTGTIPTLADLQQAVKLAPDDPRYVYHLALTHHRLEQIEQAEPLYRQLLALSPPFQRAAFPLAQLLVEKGQTVTTDTVWSHLNEEQQNCLSAVLALNRNQPVAALRYISPGQADFLWSGLAAFALGEAITAHQDFEIGLDKLTLRPLAGSVAHYYLGLLATQANRTELALTHWYTAQSDGLDTPHLRQNLAVLLYQQARAEQQAGHPSKALSLTLPRLWPSCATNSIWKQGMLTLNKDVGPTHCNTGKRLRELGTIAGSLPPIWLWPMIGWGNSARRPSYGERLSAVAPAVPTILMPLTMPRLPACGNM